MIEPSIGLTTAVGTGFAIAFWSVVLLGLLLLAGLLSSSYPRTSGGRIPPV